MGGGEIIMVRRDGRLLQFGSGEIESVDPVSTVFAPHSMLAVQEHLRKIFGNRYEVSRTARYVVVHPRGKRREWAEPFDALYNRFTHYFNVRGYSLKPPEFPLVVVVLGTREEFSLIARRDGVANPDSWAGYYSPESNWIVTRDEGNVSANDATLVHEALHQFAFNCGVHQRWAATPKWCAEGLAAMFESRGVNNSGRYTSSRDRVNSYYSNVLKERVPPDRAGSLLETTVAADDLFDRDAELAYALSWGLVWYLAETRPADFNRYLQKVAVRPRLRAYSRGDRLADFHEAFGIEFTMLGSHFATYVRDAK